MAKQNKPKKKFDTDFEYDEWLNEKDKERIADEYWGVNGGEY